MLHHRLWSPRCLLTRRSKKTILSVNGDNIIKWANKGGVCVIPLPPVVYNGRKHVAEKSPKGSMAGRTYELFGVESHCIYYGTYSCVKVVTMNWGALSSLGREVSKHLGCSLKVCPPNKETSSRTPSWRPP